MPPLFYNGYRSFTVLDIPDQVVIGIFSFDKTCNRGIESVEVVELHKGLSDLFEKLRRKPFGKSNGILLDVSGL